MQSTTTEDSQIFLIPTDVRALAASAVCLHAPVAQGRRSVAGVGSAWPVDRGLRSFVGRVPWLGCGVVGVDDRSADAASGVIARSRDASVRRWRNRFGSAISAKAVRSRSTSAWASSSSTSRCLSRLPGRDRANASRAPASATWCSFAIVDRFTRECSAASPTVASPRTNCIQISYFSCGARNRFFFLPG